MYSLKYLNKYLFKYRKRLIWGILFVTISNLFGIFPAQLIRNALDVVAANINSFKSLNGFSVQEDYRSLIISHIFLFGALVLLMALLKGVFMFFMRQTIIVMSRLIEYDLKNELFHHYQNLDMAFYNKNNTGDLMNRISEDVSRVRMYIGPAIMYAINLLVMFILVIWAMVKVNLALTLYVLLPLPLMVFTVYKVHSIINKKGELVQEKLSTLSAFIQEAFSGIRIIKSFAREKVTKERFQKESEHYKEISMDLVKVNSLFFPVLFFLIGISNLNAIYIGGLKIMDGSITAGNVAEFVIYVNMLTWPVASLGWVVTLIQRAAASQKRINEFLNTQPEIISPTKSDFTVKGNVEFKNVTYTYPGTQITALKNISFKLQQGSSLGIIGRTGSGKTTISNLLLRLVDPVEGKILVDGADLKKINLNDFRKQAGYVPQDVFLFSDSIRNNIAFGLDVFTSSQNNLNELVLEASKNASVYDNILEFSSGFETMIGERGITLSGGQKQRISIARAIIRNPALLIFDDCLSAVDTKTEESILGNLKRLMKNKTTIIIGHRISSVRLANSIIVLEKGEIIEQGTHEELLDKKGAYFEIYSKQSFEKEEVN